MRIVVVGAGAMGSIYGGWLSEGNEVLLVDTNPATVEKINSEGLAIEREGEVKVFRPGAAAGASAFGGADLVLLFVKALQSRPALDNVRPSIGKGTCLMSLQNGAGHEDVLKDYASPERIVIGTTEANGAVLAPGRVRMGGKPVTNLGPAFPSCDRAMLERVASAFSSSGFTVNVMDDIRRLVWDKLMVNVSLSALTGVLQRPMGFIASDPHASALAKALVDEAVAVANASGLAFDSAEVFRKVMEVSRANPEGRTSIMADLALGRRTEVDTITGAVVKEGARLGVPTPNHSFVLNLVHAMEARG